MLNPNDTSPLVIKTARTVDPEIDPKSINFSVKYAAERRAVATPNQLSEKLPEE